MKTLTVATLALLIGACGGPMEPGAPSAANLSLAVIAGDAQIDTVGHTLALPVVATAATLQGGAARQVVVNWYRVAGPDTVFAGAALTDANGEARMRWTLLPRAGAQELVCWIVDAAGERYDYAKAAATANHDRATVVMGSRLDTLVVDVGAIVRDHDSYSAAYDRFGNWAGRLIFQPSAGWRVSADTAWAEQSGLYRLQLALDDVTAHIVVRVR